MESKILKAARHYHGVLRFSIIPCRGKRPALASWKRYGTNPPTAAEIEDWFSQTPEPAIGLVLGAVSGIWAVDCDDEAAVEWFEDNLPFDPSELRVSQTLRGRHYFFRIPQGCSVRSHNFKQPAGVAVEFKGEGTYIILPPSKRADVDFQYEYLHKPRWDTLPELNPRHFEPALISLAESLGKKVPGKKEFKAPVDFKPAEVGARNDTVFRILCKIAGKNDLNFEDFKYLGKSLNAANPEPLPETELMPTIESAFKYQEPTPLTELRDTVAKTETLTPEEAVTEPAPLEWTLRDSLLKHSLGMIFGPPGAGKGLFTAALAISLSGGKPLFETWYPVKKHKVMTVSVEDTKQILHHRVRDAMADLSPEELDGLDFRFVSVQGRIGLVESVKGTVQLTEYYKEFEAMVRAYGPDVLILDTLVRFVSGDENDNSLMNAICETFESFAELNKCNIILLHHSAKRAGDVINTRRALADNLSQTSVRGASSISGALRWILQIVPISCKLGGILLGQTEPLEGEDGCHVAVKVVKKNTGPPEKFIILEKTGGKLVKLENIDLQTKEEEIETLLVKLIEEITRRAADGEEPLPSGRPELVLGWHRGNTIEAVKRGLERGLLIKVKNERKNGFHLEVAPEEESTDE